eukprot:350539-Prymnesium_polylepis.1
MGPLPCPSWGCLRRSGNAAVAMQQRVQRSHEQVRVIHTAMGANNGGGGVGSNDVGVGDCGGHHLH